MNTLSSLHNLLYKIKVFSFSTPKIGDLIPKFAHIDIETDTNMRCGIYDETLVHVVEGTSAEPAGKALTYGMSDIVRHIFLAGDRDGDKLFKGDRHPVYYGVMYPNGDTVSKEERKELEKKHINPDKLRGQRNGHTGNIRKHWMK
jgi:hypothetical protein